MIAEERLRSYHGPSHLDDISKAITSTKREVFSIALNLKFMFSFDRVETARSFSPEHQFDQDNSKHKIEDEPPQKRQRTEEEKEAKRIARKNETSEEMLARKERKFARKEKRKNRAGAVDEEEQALS